MAVPRSVLVAGRPSLRLGRFSGVWRPRMVSVTLTGMAALVLVMAANIGLGDFPISVVEVLGVLIGGGTGAEQFIVLELRLPRTLTGALVGAALGMSGAITQAVARNPLASPDILGVTAGASMAAVGLIVLGTVGPMAALLSGVSLPVAALFGGIAAALLVYVLAWRRGIEGYRLVLVGIGIQAVALSLTQWLLIVAKINEAARATVWLTGSLNGRGWEHVMPVALTLTVLVPIALALTLGLGVLQFGDDTARGLGIRVNRARSALILVAVGLAAVATSSAGPILFVALVVPQITQRLVGAARPPLLASAVYGALLTVGSDLVARTVLGSELPVGIVTAVLGAPYLLYLLARRNREVTA
ncbi:MAG: iron chelate uptake ABC transporter family permease subunit [Actinobacteria bacterium]|nr:iron chelate uptake ABC transporter family permease subunit [Actinomycetota bacterium]